ncbi:MAG: anaerobic ribonucleoside triphosphate reductase [Oscillospiraceae bacterium]|nr:anaerobic ribonucleoside triphosphate reductase [Oscillospiraceae bacterium]
MTERVLAVDAIKKRDGRVVGFDCQKVARAMEKAFFATCGSERSDVAHKLSLQVYDVLLANPHTTPDVEGIQDIVEQVLMDNGHVQTAKAYILYRAQRSRQREMNTSLMKIYEDISFSDAATSDVKRENANIDGDTAMGTMLKYGTEGAKQFYDMFMLNPEHSAAHKEGDIHIHDLDFYGLTTTCCQIDIIKLFSNGFSTGHGTLREPNHISSYAALACIAIQANQNDQHGGQSVMNFDYGLALGVAKTYANMYADAMSNALELLGGIENAREIAKATQARILESANLKPVIANDNGYADHEAALLLSHVDDEKLVVKMQTFARKQGEKETERATYQAMQALVHNLNTMHSRAGAQTPFSSINYGMDTSPEGRMVIRNVLLATEAGLGRGETPIFPIHVFRVKESINYNPGDPSYDLFQLACRVSAKRLFPNFAFVDAPFNLKFYKPDDPNTHVSYMGCRTRVLSNAYDPTKEISGGRGNLSFSSLNLPRMAIKANRNVTQFFEELDRKIDMLIEQMYERYEVQAKKRVYNFPFLMGQGVWLDSEKLGPNDTIGEVLKHGTLSMGFIGLAETLVALTGSHHGESEIAQNLGLEIIGHIRARLDAESKKRGMNFTLLATPAEGLCGRFVKLDKNRYGEITGVTDKDFYTNSFHIPVEFDIGIYDKIQLEAPYHALTNAGHITYVELDGDTARNPEAFEKVIRIMKDAGVGYGSINHPVDQDPVCGFSGIIDDECPQCGRTEADGQGEFERIRRVTGYLAGSIERFNNAKRAEERARIKHEKACLSEV